MLTLLIVTGLILMAGGIIMLANAKRTRTLKQQRIQGLNILIQLKSLLVQIQQHRGLSNGALSGDKKMILRADSLEKVLTQTFKEIGKTDEKIASNTLFESIFSHWSRLSSRWKSLTVTNNLEQHNRLIINLLYLIENISESYQLDSICPDDNAIAFIWRELLETAESIGQIRALGTGIVATGGSDSIQRIKVRFLNEKIGRMQLELKDLINLSDGNIDARAIVQPLKSRMDTTSRQVSKLVTLSERELFKTADINISTEDFFKLATECMEPLLAMFDESVEKLRQHI